MTIFKKAMYICGLSQKEAAEFLGVPINTVKKWSNGAMTPKPNVFVELADLLDKQYQNAQKEHWHWYGVGKPDELEIFVAKNDTDAIEQGWPCASAQLAIAAQVQMMIAPARVVIKTT